ncbi:MAG TPA: glycosyltransferase [Coriobacteriia bacterium]|jgi:glycosyltransferase involved in cell wall biosynthesis
MTSKRIHYVVDDFHACGWYRANVPGTALSRLGYDVALTDKMTPADVQQADVIVFQRQWCPAALQAMDYGKALGKLTVYELDDDLWNIHPSNPAYAAWNDPRLVACAEALMRRADVITTTTPALAKQLRRFNDNVRILPNMLPGENWQVERERPEGYDKVALGWAGSIARKRDLEIVKHVIPQILEQYPQAEFLLAGHPSNQIFPEHPRIRTVEPLPIERYAEVLVQFDVGLAPVVDSRFNQAKSDLKFVEYGMVGIPTVASNVEAYTHSIVNGETGFLAKNDKDWLKYLRRLIESPELLAEMGRNAKEFAEGRTISRNIGLWERAYGIAGEEQRDSA